MADHGGWGTMRELIGILITYNGGAIYHRSKKLSTTTANTTEGESIATSRAGEIVEVARNALEAAGELQNHPTFVGTDNKPNMLIASMQGNASRVRHALRRWAVFQQRVQDGTCAIGHIPDSQMMADFLTKWVDKTKMATSVAYATNSRNRVASSSTA